MYVDGLPDCDVTCEVVLKDIIEEFQNSSINTLLDRYLADIVDKKNRDYGKLMICILHSTMKKKGATFLKEFNKDAYPMLQDTVSYLGVNSTVLPCENANIVCYIIAQIVFDSHEFSLTHEEISSTTDFTKKIVDWHVCFMDTLGKSRNVK